MSHSSLSKSSLQTVWAAYVDFPYYVEIEEQFKSTGSLRKEKGHKFRRIKVVI